MPDAGMHTEIYNVLGLVNWDFLKCMGKGECVAASKQGAGA